MHIDYLELLHDAQVVFDNQSLCAIALISYVK